MYIILVVVDILLPVFISNFDTPSSIVTSYVFLTNQAIIPIPQFVYYLNLSKPESLRLFNFKYAFREIQFLRVLIFTDKFRKLKYETPS